MPTDDEMDFHALGNCRAGDDRYELQRLAVKRAHRLRSRYVLALAVTLATPVAHVLRRLGAAFVRLREARADRRAIARLQSLDDVALKDIGIRRSEIESIVHCHGNDATRTRRDNRIAA